MSTREPWRGARSTPSTPWPFLERTRGAGGQLYLYYRRGGRRIPLPQPEGSAGFVAAYERARVAFEGRPRQPASGLHTAGEAVIAYLAGPDYAQLAPGSRADYRRVLDRFREAFGDVPLGAMDEGWIEELRGKYTAAPIAWNQLRSRMIVVVRHYRRLHPGALAANHWETSLRLKVARSRLHRRWSRDDLLAVLRAATPEFRCLLVGYLMTAQRGGDVTRFSPAQWDAAEGTLALGQEKTGERLLIHVPASLRVAFTAMTGRHPDRLFVTPRRRPWTTANAQETLARLVAQLGLDGLTLHGLRKTAASALKQLGFENRVIRTLTGHTSDANLELYLDGVDHLPLARQAQEALEEAFGPLLAEAEAGANTRRFSGVTGRAARSKLG
jgi:integrase